MASAQAEGPSVFREIYSVDRPLRAYVLAPAYMLFGQNVLLYNLSAWFFRTLSALFLLWLLRRLWYRHSQWTLLMALLYAIYPGFLSQLNGIDYQAQILSLALAAFSLVLTVLAFYEGRPAYRIAAIFFAILMGNLYLGLVEYEVGFEFLRLTILFILVSRTPGNTRERLFKILKLWFPYSLIILGFGIWQLFFFESERGATDVAVQFSQFKLYPLQTLYHWVIQVAQDFLDVMFSAWAIPLSQLTSFIQYWGVALAILATGLVLFVSSRLESEKNTSGPEQVNIQNEALLLGLVTAIGGLIPIVMVNREVWFPSFSRYSLVSSVGVAILIPAILMRLKSNFLRQGLTAAFCLSALLTHHANAVKHAQETAAVRNFWWQVAWRVPQFEKNTTLVAVVPGVVLEEDYFVWGPASLIYYPEKQNLENIQPGLFAALLNQDTVDKVLARERQEYDKRKNIITYKNYRNIVILTQPFPGACVRVLDGVRPEFSHTDPDSIRAIGPYSEIEHVLADETPHAPPEIVFRSEPPHGWCYFYQKADLERQKGAWDEVIKIGEQAAAQNLTPADLIEWMPFLQAYAQTGNLEHLQELAPIIRTDPFIASQACEILVHTLGLSAGAVETIKSLYCSK